MSATGRLARAVRRLRRIDHPLALDHPVRVVHRGREWTVLTVPSGMRPQPLFFLHIPKTAGTSLANLLEDVFGPDNTVRHLEYVAGAIGEGRMNTLSADLVTAHMPAASWVPRPGAEAYATTTVLRRPWARLVSHVNYMDSRDRADLKGTPKPQIHAWRITRAADFESRAGLIAFRDAIDALDGHNPFDNYQLRMLLPRVRGAMFDDLRSGRVPRALDYLHSMIAVGFVDRMEAYLNTLLPRLGADPADHPLPRSNVGAKGRLSPDNDLAKEILSPWFERDAALVMAARQQFLKPAG